MVLFTENEFDQAVTSNGYASPHSDIYTYLHKNVKNDFSKEEAAMLIAQLIHESGGFQYKEEIAQPGNKNNGRQYYDSVGFPDKNYHGRGFIQLSWGANYRDASRVLGLGDELLRHPERVAEDTKLAVDVSVWFWRTRVRPQLCGQSNMFGATTRAINGAIECTGGTNKLAKNKWNIYLKVADALHISNRAKEGGCYCV